MMSVDLFTRREALKSVSGGVGYLAFAALAHEQARAEGKPLDVKKTHFTPRAKRVIFLSMQGAPSHVDTFDYKPQLQADQGKAGKYGEFRGAKLMGSKWEFKQRGKNGLWISELFPNLAKQADDLCLLRGMHTDLPNHPQAQTQMHTGSFQFVRPSIGAWSLYGLGSENENLPGFVALGSGRTAAQHIGSAFLPAIYQGTKLSGGGRQRRGNSEVQIPNIKNPKLDTNLQRVQLDFMRRLNEGKLKREGHQPGVEGVIESCVLGLRMAGEGAGFMVNRRQPWRAMGLMEARLTNSGGSVCWPVALWKRACALWKFRTETGITIVICRKTYRLVAGRLINRLPACWRI
jgi:hypothetical protein